MTDRKPAGLDTKNQPTPSLYMLRKAPGVFSVTPQRGPRGLFAICLAEGYEWGDLAHELNAQGYALTNDRAAAYGLKTVAKIVADIRLREVTS